MAEIEYRDPSSLSPHPRNSRVHSDAQVDLVASSITEFGFTIPVLVQADGTIIAGHCRTQAALRLGMEAVPCIVAGDDWPDEKVRAYVIADNRLTERGQWDLSILQDEVRVLSDAGFNLSVLGMDDAELARMISDDDLSGVSLARAMLAEPPEDTPRGRLHAPLSLSDRFGVPPFSVLNAREGWWQARKASWIALGIESKKGRGDDVTWGAAPEITSAGLNHYRDAKKKYVRSYNTTEWIKQHGMTGGGSGPKGQQGETDVASGTSIFDPVLCELAYRWFVPTGGRVLDPFAGGSVRGIVAAKLGLRYTGVDLRPEQVLANREQAQAVCGEGDPVPRWVTGDSRNLRSMRIASADFIFSCPPYADLEVYSDDPNDLSNLAYPDFRDAYSDIIGKACARLSDNRFACFVVGEVRGKDGAYYDFVGDTVQAFRDAGLSYYNEMILVTMAGSLPIRAGKQFTATRKIGKTHQNVLVFVKGDPRKAVAALGAPSFGELGDGTDA